MRIAFAGASGTGKTTLAKWLAARQGLELCPVGSRSIAAEFGFATPYDVDKASVHIWSQVRMAGRPKEEAAQAAIAGFIPGTHTSCRARFQLRLQQEKILWERTHSKFVTDRTVLDDCAYAMIHCPEVVDEAFLQRALHHASSRYDAIFLCPVMGQGGFLNTDGDPARVAERSYHLRYDMIIHGLVMAVWHIDSELQTGDPSGISSITRFSSSDLEARKELISVMPVGRTP